MALQDQDLFIVLSHASIFLNQNDLLNLSLTSKEIHDVIAIPYLYRNIHITKNPVLRTKKWFLEGGITYISGYRSISVSYTHLDVYKRQP